jgi:hypothetical protein
VASGELRFLSRLPAVRADEARLDVYRELGTRARSRYIVIVVRGAGHNTFTAACCPGSRGYRPTAVRRVGSS